MRRVTMPRYIPENSKELKFEEVGLVVYTFESISGKPSAIAYRGNSSKSVWCYAYANEDNRDKAIKEEIARCERSIVYKEERKQERSKARKELLASISVGDIFYSSWGYEQTNVSFYQITKFSGSTVELTPLSDELVESSGMDQGYKMPIKDKFFINDFHKVISKRILGDRINLSSFESLSKWSGEKVWCSWYY